MARHFSRCLLPCMVCALLVGCAGLPLPPSIAPRSTTVLGGVTSDAPRPRVLEPGDLLSIEATTVPPIQHDGLVVDGRGSLHVPGIGDIDVGGATTGVAQARIEQALQRHDKLGKVFVRVTDARGHRMTVVGAVGTQGAVAIVPGMRLVEAVAAAGGIAQPVLGSGGQPIEMPDVSGARLVRDGVRVPIDVARAIEGAPHHNVRVRPRDHLFVPWRASTIAVLGQVEAPTVMQHRDGLRVMEAIAVAGGITVDGDKSDVRLIRGPVEQPLVYRADVAAIVDAERADIELLPGDVLFVTDDPVEDVHEVLAMVGPTLALALTAAVLSLTL